MVGIDIIIGYFVTGIIWGSTDALMEVGSKNDEKKTAEEKSNELKEGVAMFTRIAFLLPFAVNQAASLLYNYLVTRSDLSTAVPIVNCITFISTFITARLLK